MQLNTYQELAKETAIYQEKIASQDGRLSYTALGLCGEAGEYADKIKKLFRDKGGVLDEVTRIALIEELGDCLWYIALCAKELDVDLDTVAIRNHQKLNDRKERNKLHGSGDQR